MSYNETPYKKGEHMFNPFRPEDPALDEAIAEVFTDLKGGTSDEETYKKSVEQLVKLYSLKPKGVDPNQLLTVIGNLAIGFAVLKFEGTGVVTTKIWNFLKKT